MVDFKNAVFLKLRPVPDRTFAGALGPMLVPGEEIVRSFQTVRDGVVFTTKRIISINIQGLTGKKTDYTSMPYSKIQVFSVESAGLLDLDAELELWFAGLGKVKFEFVPHSNVADLCRLISQYVLM